MFGHTGFNEVICLVTKRERNSHNSSTQTISNDASIDSLAEVPLGHPIKVGFVPVFVGKRPSGLLSSLDLVFLSSFTIPTFLDVFALGYSIVLQSETFNFLNTYEL